MLESRAVKLSWRLMTCRSVAKSSFDRTVNLANISESSCSRRCRVDASSLSLASKTRAHFSEIRGHACGPRCCSLETDPPRLGDRSGVDQVPLRFRERIHLPGCDIAQPR